MHTLCSIHTMIFTKFFHTTGRTDDDFEIQFQVISYNYFS